MSPEWQALRKTSRGRKPPAAANRPSRASPERKSAVLAGCEAEGLRGRRREVVDDPDEQVPLAQRRLVGGRPGDLPGDAGECRGQAVLVLRRAGQLDAERALGLRSPEGIEDIRAEYL